MLKELLRSIGERPEHNQGVVVALSTSARAVPHSRMLPDRRALGFRIVNGLVADEETAEQVLMAIDGLVTVVLVDVERKQNIDLWAVAKDCLRKTKPVPIKPNDATVEAAMQLLKNWWKGDVIKRKVMVWGAGNIGSKLALRLAEMDNMVYLYSRNMEKAGLIAETMNSVLPRFADGRVLPGDRVGVAPALEALISFVNAREVVTKDWVSSLSRKALVIDGGIDNLSAGFIAEALERGMRVLRLDARVGFAHIAMDLAPEVGEFFADVQGEREIDGIRVVAGGVVGKQGDVVLDRINATQRVIGVANGTGGVFDGIPPEYNERVERIREAIAREAKGSQKGF